MKAHITPGCFSAYTICTLSKLSSFFTAISKCIVWLLVKFVLFLNHEKIHKELSSRPIIYDADAEQVREETDDPRAMLRPIEVADLLDLHINTVYRLFQDGIIPAFKLRGSWRVYKKDLIHFINRQS